MSATKSRDEIYHKVDHDLYSWLRERSQEDFPRRADYATQFAALRAQLNDILKEVPAAAILAEARTSIEQGETDPDALIYLTNHGRDHVEQVVQRAKDLLRDSNCELSSYEGYILLTAILFHDVGNIYGRKNHEERVWQIMNKLGPLAGNDTFEKQTITKIALVHTGKFERSKDTISQLQEREEVLGKPVRKRFLAAILRFADELADDFSRASRYMLDAKMIPDTSLIYHRYSESLKSVRVENGEVRLRFHFDAEELMRQYTKNGEPTFLLDEINERVLRMHRERMYCMRFMRPGIDISSIRVDISIFDLVADLVGENNAKSAQLKAERLQYTLTEGGYPECPEDLFLSHCSGENVRKKGAEMKALFEARRSKGNA